MLKDYLFKSIVPVNGSQQKKRKQGLYILLLAFHTAPIFCQEILFTIDFGPAEGQVFAFESEGELWYPRFFGIDDSNNLVIPDIYNGRLFKYNFESQSETFYLSSISPRFNYFSVFNNGDQLVFDDSTLYIQQSDGSMIWNYQFGLGFLPYAIYSNESFIFVIPSSSNTHSILFDRFSGSILGAYGITEDGIKVPYISTVDGQSYSFFNQFNNHPNVSLFLGQLNENILVWKSSISDFVEIILTDLNLNIINTFGIPKETGDQKFGSTFQLMDGYLYYSLVTESTLSIARLHIGSTE